MTSPYFVKTRNRLKLSETQRALVVWDVFKGQVTLMKRMLTSLHIIESVTVPVNMTCFFQPLDSTVNEAAKHFMKKQFAFDISNEVKHQLDTGKRDEDIDVDMRIHITAIKPLHTQWLVNKCNFFNTVDVNITKGWRKADISDKLDGSTILTLPPVDPFEDLTDDSC